MKHRNVRAAVSQKLSNFQSAHSHDAARNNQNVLTVSEQLCFPELKAIVILIEYQRNLTP
ncbi:hypothetical protein D3C72_2228560 [compost metagenome]